MKTGIQHYLDEPAFSLAKTEKTTLFRERFAELTDHHIRHCGEYRKMLDALGGDVSMTEGLESGFFLPVRLFKDFELRSIPESEVFKTLTSSGTSGGNVSKIFLDRTAATMQTKVLAKIVSEFIGSSRLPMLVIDCPATVKDHTRFSARAAAIRGFSIFAKGQTFALDDDLRLDMDALEAFVEKHGDGPVLVFGFTSIVYKHFVEALADRGLVLSLDQGILIHGGGWKKLQDIAVDNVTFKQRLLDITGIPRVHNYYGMVEQTGSIFLECEEGYLHCSNFSDVIIRDPDFRACPNNVTGLIQLLSLLPESYPGHNLLSEDIGEIVGEDDCACGRKGKYFLVHGRAEQAEIRGCSDTIG